MHRSRVFSLLAVVFVFGLVARPAHAESSSGVIAGIVVDQTGSPVAGAAVTLHADGRASLGTATDEAGRFRFHQASGTVLLEVEAPGFRRASRTIRLSGRSRAIDERITLLVDGLNETVLVTAAGAPRSIDETSKAISVIEADEMEDRHEYALGELLRTTPGVQVRTLGGPGRMTQVRLRGLRGDATAVLLDGMRLRDPSSTQGDATGLLSSLHLVSAGRVEVLRGSGSSLYGSHAVGGAINMVTRQGGAPTRGDALVEAGSLGLVRGRATLGGGARDNRVMYAAGASHLNVRHGLEGHNGARHTGLQGSVSMGVSPGSRVTGRFFGADSWTRLSAGPTTSGIPPGNFPGSGPIPAIPLARDQVRALDAGEPVAFGSATFIPDRTDPDNTQVARFYSATASWSQTIASRATLQAGYGRVSTRRLLENGPTGPGFQPPAPSVNEPRGEIDTANVRVDVFASPRYQLTAGYELEREAYRSYQNNHLEPPALVVSRTRVSQWSHAAFMQHQFSLAGDRLQVLASGRTQSFRLSPPEFLTSGIDNVYAHVPLESPARALTADLSLAWLPVGRSTKLRAHAGNAYRAPSLFERFGGGFFASFLSGQVAFTPYGDPGLAPDRYNSFDAGLDQYLARNRVRLSATYFYTRIRQVIVFDFSGLLDPATDPFGRGSGYINGDGGLSRGVELSAEARPGRGLNVSGSYTFTNAVNDRDAQIPGYWRALSMPRHTATLVVRQSLGTRTNVTFDLFHGSSYVIGFFAVDRTRPFEFPGFTKADLVASYEVWRTTPRSMRLFVKVDNLLNERVYEHGFRTPGTTALAGATYAF